jgi:hypothetical protein
MKQHARILRSLYRMVRYHEMCPNVYRCNTPHLSPKPLTIPSRQSSPAPALYIRRIPKPLQMLSPLERAGLIPLLTSRNLTRVLLREARFPRPSCLRHRVTSRNCVTIQIFVLLALGYLGRILILGFGADEVGRGRRFSGGRQR